MLKLFIGNRSYSSWSLRGWLACKQSGLPFEEIVVPMFTTAWDDARASGPLALSGKVPTLCQDHVVTWDSFAIIAYLDEASGGTRFWPADPPARAFARSIAAEMHSSFPALRSACPMNIRRRFAGWKAPEDAAEAIAADVSRIVALWSHARDRFSSEGAFLFGQFGAADIMYAPVVSRFVTYDIALPDLASSYAAAVMAHPFMQEWQASADAEPWVIEKYEMAGR